MGRFALVQERLIGLYKCLYSNCLVDAARRALLIVPMMPGLGNR